MAHEVWTCSEELETTLVRVTLRADAAPFTIMITPTLSPLSSLPLPSPAPAPPPPFINRRYTHRVLYLASLPGVFHRRNYSRIHRHHHQQEHYTVTLTAFEATAILIVKFHF